MFKTEKEKAIKKVQIAIDKMVDLQDMGLGNDNVARILERLNSEESELMCE